MFYVPIQKDFSQVKNKVALGLTKRQLVCFALAALVGVPIFLLLKKVIAHDLAAIVMIIVMSPFFLFALYERNGQPLEEIIKNVVKEKYLRPQIRPVANEPLLYSVIQVADYIEETERIKKEANKKALKTKVLNTLGKGGTGKNEKE